MTNTWIKTWKSALPGAVLALTMSLGLTVSFPGSAHAQAASLEEATDQIKEIHPGCRVLRADTIVRDNGEKVYRLKVLTEDGTVKTVRVEASDENSKSRDQRSPRRRYWQ